jgi:hypothetical protein
LRARYGPLVEATLTNHGEQLDPNVRGIGRVQGVVCGRLSLLQTGPHAKWEDSPEEYRVAEITRVNFGGDYEDSR